MKHYEASFIISPELSEDDAKNKLNELTVKIQEIGGSSEFNLEQRAPIKRRLAYPIRKKEIAYLASVYFSLEAGKINEIKKLLDEDKSILRSLIIIHKEQKKKEIPQIFKKEEKEGEKTPKTKVDLEEVDKKLDEILE